MAFTNLKKSVDFLFYLNSDTLFETVSTLVLLCGRMEEIFYEESADGALRESDRILLSAEGPVQGLNIPLGRWHSINVLEPTVILECKDGKYEPLSQDDMISM